MLKSFKNYLQKDKWPPYLAGFLIGSLAFFSMAFFKHTIGSSVAFVKFSAFIVELFSPKHVQNSIYYMSYLKNNAWIDWQVMLVAGAFIGAYLAHKISKPDIKTDSKTIETSCYKKEKPLSQPDKRGYFISFLGGIVLLLGARFAGGCTSGHAISGGMQLAVSSWLYMGGLFATAIPTALIIYKVKKGNLKCK